MKGEGWGPVDCVSSRDDRSLFMSCHESRLFARNKATGLTQSRTECSPLPELTEIRALALVTAAVTFDSGQQELQRFRKRLFRGQVD